MQVIHTHRLSTSLSQQVDRALNLYECYQAEEIQAYIDEAATRLQASRERLNRVIESVTPPSTS